jgi:hypothetical protein
MARQKHPKPTLDPTKPVSPPKRKRAKGSSAVMQQRTEALDSLDFYPTPPWATRAFCEFVLGKLGFSIADLKKMICAEPAAGEGHMAEILREYFGEVRASDVFDYGRNYEVASYTGEGPDILSPMDDVDFVITNPPFIGALPFVERALKEAKVGVAMLVRLAWIETETRWPLFCEAMPTAVFQYVERVPMQKGLWDPEGSTATAYAWVVWIKPFVGIEVRDEARMIWIPPGQQLKHHRTSDVAKFVKYEPMPLFDGLPPASVEAPVLQPVIAAAPMLELLSA